MKILILGGNGNIGGFLSKSLRKYYDVISLSRNYLDITDKDNVIKKIASYSPDAVIDAAGIADMDFCEFNEDASYSINTLGTMNVAIACAKLDIPIIYISTAQVYGSNENFSYSEKDACNPINVFSKSKLAGENLIRTLCSKYFIIRTSWCFGGENCFVKKILKKKDVPIFMVADMTLNITYLGDLSNAILSMIKSNEYGIYNCANKGSISKLDLVKYVFSFLGYNKKIFKLPDSTLKSLAPRPKSCTLKTNLIESSFDIEMPSWDIRMNQYLKDINSFYK